MKGLNLGGQVKPHRRVLLPLTCLLRREQSFAQDRAQSLLSQAQLTASTYSWLPTAKLGHRNHWLA